MHDESDLTSTSPSLSSLISHARRRRPDRADLDLVARVDAAGAAGLAHAPQLGERQPDRVEELEHLDGRRSGADVDRLDLVEAEHRAQPGEDLLVGALRPARRARRAPARPPVRGAPSEAHASSAASTFAALLLGLGGEHRLQPGLQLLPDPRHGEEPARAHFGQVGEDLARVLAAGDLQAEDDRQVVMGVALGDVRRSAATRSRARPRGNSISSSSPSHAASRLRWISWTPFGGPVVPEV